MNYYQHLKQAGGVMRAEKLKELGVSRYKQAQLIAEQRLIRPHRGWLALPHADPQLIFAAQHRVVLTCMTLVQRLKLWSTHRTGYHVAARSASAHHGRVGAVTHWKVPLVRREPFALVDSLENALNYVAHCQPYEEAFAVWESALRRELVSRETLLQLPLHGAALQLANECSVFSDSGLESFVLRRLRALRLKVIPQAWILGHHVDFLVEDWLVLQIDGAQHEGAQRDSDNAHDSVLKLAGYVVIRLSYRMVMHRWATAQGLIMQHLAQGRHLPR
ncbi:endonuclease domain-containing protein [Leucobacter sp. HY1910]